MNPCLKSAGTLAVVIFYVTGCSTAPVYEWRADQLVAGKTPPVDNTMSMTRATDHLQKARNAYRTQLNNQMKGEATASQWLIGSAGVLLAAAGLKAHADALLVGGTAMSTGYAMSTTAMPRGRVLAYMAGVEALNCAEASVAPIRTFDDQKLATANKDLKAKVQLLRTAIVETTAAYKAAPAHVMSINVQTDSAEATVVAANRVVSSTDDFLQKTRSAAFLLYNQVEKVDAAVTRSIINGMPTLADVKVLAGTIGPDITALVTKAVNDANASKTAQGDKQLGAQSSEESALGSALKILKTRQGDVNDAIAVVQDALPPNADNLNMQVMADCNLPSVPSPLTLNPAEVQFYTGANTTKVIELKGGTKEYAADDKVLPQGLTLRQPGATGTSFEIISDATKLVAVGTYKLRLRDQTPGASAVYLTVTVVAGAAVGPAASASGAPGAPKPAPRAAPAPTAKPATPAIPVAPVTPAHVAQAIDGKIIEVAGSKYTLSNTTPNADKSLTVLVCPPVPADALGRQALIDAVKKLSGVNSVFKVDTVPGCKQ
jgi:hypothetical protein